MEMVNRKMICPSYVSRFRCDGQDCSSRCCRGWGIEVDDGTYDRFEALPEGKELLSGIYFHEEKQKWLTKHREDGSCIFLDADLLCTLQKRYGEAMLSNICHEYPRVTYEISDFAEQSMALSCPVAAKEILLDKSPMRFTEQEIFPEQRLHFWKKPRHMEAWQGHFLTLQKLCIRILQERAVPIPDRLERLGRFLGRLEERAGDGEWKLSEENISLCFEQIHSMALQETALTEQEAWQDLVSMSMLLSDLYERPYSEEKASKLAEALLPFLPLYEQNLQEYSYLLENYLVNEFFLRLYPFAFKGSFADNFRMLDLRFHIMEFSMLVMVSAKKRLLTQAQMLELVDRAVELLDHNPRCMKRLQELTIPDPERSAHR